MANEGREIEEIVQNVEYGQFVAPPAALQPIVEIYQPLLHPTNAPAATTSSADEILAAEVNGTAEEAVVALAGMAQDVDESRLLSMASVDTATGANAGATTGLATTEDDDSAPVAAANVAASSLVELIYNPNPAFGAAFDQNQQQLQRWLPLSPSDLPPVTFQFSWSTPPHAHGRTSPRYRRQQRRQSQPQTQQTQSELQRQEQQQQQFQLRQHRQRQQQQQQLNSPQRHLCPQQHSPPLMARQPQQQEYDDFSDWQLFPQSMQQQQQQQQHLSPPRSHSSPQKQEPPICGTQPQQQQQQQQQQQLEHLQFLLFDQQLPSPYNHPTQQQQEPPIPATHQECVADVLAQMQIDGGSADASSDAASPYKRKPSSKAGERASKRASFAAAESPAARSHASAASHAAAPAVRASYEHREMATMSSAEATASAQQLLNVVFDSGEYREGAFEINKVEDVPCLDLGVSERLQVAVTRPGAAAAAAHESLDHFLININRRQLKTLFPALLIPNFLLGRAVSAAELRELVQNGLINQHIRVMKRLQKQKQRLGQHEHD